MGERVCTLKPRYQRPQRSGLQGLKGRGFCGQKTATELPEKPKGEDSTRKAYIVGPAGRLDEQKPPNLQGPRVARNLG